MTETVRRDLSQDRSPARIDVEELFGDHQHQSRGAGDA
jgi:hypothetical protein